MFDLGDWTSIPVKKETLKKLNQFQGAIQMKIGERFSYDAIVNVLLMSAPDVPMSLIKRVKSK